MRRLTCFGEHHSSSNQVILAAWHGIGQGLQFGGDVLEADKSHIKSIELDEFSEIAECARTARTQIAEKGFHAAAGRAAHGCGDVLRVRSGKVREDAT